MRLIDADALIKRFEGLRDEHETLAISYVALYEVLVAQPTVYDPEKVVEEVKDYRDLVTGCYLREIIEIVRKGGVE